MSSPKEFVDASIRHCLSFKCTGADVFVSPLQKAVDGHTVVVFSKSWCPYCKRAKALLATEYPEVKPVIFESVAISLFISGCIN
jgi:thiol-disulfide isomerase/thioredoxin